MVKKARFLTSDAKHGLVSKLKSPSEILELEIMTQSYRNQEICKTKPVPPQADLHRARFCLRWNAV